MTIGYYQSISVVHRLDGTWQWSATSTMGGGTIGTAKTEVDAWEQAHHALGAKDAVARP